MREDGRLMGSVLAVPMLYHTNNLFCFGSYAGY